MARENYPDPNTKRTKEGDLVFRGERNFGDGLSGELTAARLQGFYVDGLVYQDIQVDVDGKLITAGGGGGGGGGPATIADGADVAQGATTDAAIVTDANGTVSGKLRGLVKWAYERMPASLGQKAKTASFPVVIASDQDALPITDNSGSLTIDAPDVIDTGNSSTATLGSSGTFTGASVELLNTRSIVVNIFSDKASASNGISFQWSSDGSNWDHIETYDLQASVGRTFQLLPRARYFRVVYTNTGSAQSIFRLQTILSFGVNTPRKEPLDATVELDEAAIYTRSAIMGRTTAGGGAFVDVKVAPSGSVQVGGTITADAGSGPWPVTDNGGSITVDGPLTDTQLRATAVPVSGTVTASGPLTDTQLRASAVPISIAAGVDVTEGNTTDAAVITDTTGTVSGKLRGLVKWAFERMPAALGQTTMAASLPVTLASNQSALPVTDNAASLTVDAPVGTPVFVRLSDGAAPIATLPVSGPLTDTQLRATAVPVSQANQHGKTVLRAVVNQGAAGTTLIAAASGGNKHKVVGVILTISADGTLKFNGGTSGDLSGPMDLKAGAGFVIPNLPECPFWESIANETLNIITTGGAARGTILYVTEA